RAGDQAAGAAFRGHDHLPAGGERVVDQFRASADVGVEHQSSLGSSTLAEAMATRPSSRPVNPRRSEVVALIATRPVEMPQMTAIASFIAATWGPMRGASQTMVISRLTMRPP